ncbi:MAG: glycosyltransferase family 2 protein [Pseudomonadota bacterium]
MPRPTIASLWIGDRLSFIEQTCLQSFLDHGHRVLLYAYGPVEGVPDGVEIGDGAEILPGRNNLRGGLSGRVAAHCDAFRYRLVATQDVVWADTDMLCLSPWEFKDGWVFGWDKPGKRLSNAVLGLPNRSRALAALNRFCENPHPIPPWIDDAARKRLIAAEKAGQPVHVSDLPSGVWGPAALSYFLGKTGEIVRAHPQSAFYPVPFRDRSDLLAPGRRVDAALTPTCFGVHLWAGRLRHRIFTDDGGRVDPESFLGRAMARHGIDSVADPIPDAPHAHREQEAPSLHPGANTPGEARSAGGSAPNTDASDDDERGKRPAFRHPQATDAPPPALQTMPIMALEQSPHRQAMIDDLENRTGPRAGWLAPPTQPTPCDRILLVTTMRNEGPFILEWIAYHLGIGATDFLVYTHDCDDPTEAILDRLQRRGIVIRCPNPETTENGGDARRAALRHAVNTRAFRDADWVLPVEIDDFVNIHVGEGRFEDFLRAANYPNVASFTWKFFGNGGIAGFEDRLVTEQFVRCAPEFIPKPRHGWGFKSMVHRSAGFETLGIHRPHGIAEADMAEVRWVNGSGRVMPEMLITNEDGRSTERTLGYRLATLNHYTLRSADSFLVKRDQDRPADGDDDHGLAHWLRQNYVSEIDTRIRTRHGLMRPVLDRLLSDRSLADLHGAAVAWHRDRIASLKSDPEHGALHKALVRNGKVDALLVSEAPPPLRRKSSAKADPAPKTRRPTPYPAPPALSPPHPRFQDAAAAARKFGGFFWQGPENALAYFPGSKRLVVSFDHRGLLGGDGARWPWAMNFLHRDLGCSILGVMALHQNGFRHSFAEASFEALRGAGFFGRFDQILLFGAGVGGFAASEFQHAAPGARVLALSPQSTLQPSASQRETRSTSSQKRHGSGRFADGPGVTDAEAEVYVVSDPYDLRDQAQLARLQGENLVIFRTPFMGQGLPRALEAMGMLKPLVTGALDGSLEAKAFYRMFRARRDCRRYLQDLLSAAEATGHIALAIQACERALRSHRTPELEATLARLNRLQDQRLAEQFPIEQLPIDPLWPPTVAVAPI